MDSLIIMKDQQAVTTSLQIAEVFEKQHKHAIETIEAKTQSAGNSAYYQSMFAEEEYKDSQSRKQRLYYMNRDGFSFIAFGLTGKEADSFKLKYIEAFDQMEELPRAQSNLPINNAELLLEAALKHGRGLTLVNQRLDKLGAETTVNRNQQRKVQGLASSTVVEVLGGRRTSAYKDSSIKQSAFSNCYKQLKALSDIASYVDISKVRYGEALTLIPK